MINFEDFAYEKIAVQKKNRVAGGTSSKGNQIKWLSGNQFIKLNTWKFYEDISEVLVSCLLEYTNVEYYVRYKRCQIIEDGELLGNGCFSYSFLKEDECNITLYRLLKNNGLNYLNPTYDEVREDLYDIIGFDLKAYLDKCLCLDAIIYNDDRHLNNLSVIKTKKGFREAPLYDHGSACLSDVFSYPLEDNLENNLSKVYAKPFSVNFKRQLDLVQPLKLDINGFLKEVENIHCRALDVIKYGLNEWRDIAWEEY